MKRVAAIHDISGFGKCSLTVALPIINAAQIECSVMPTVVLSAHTGFDGFTFRDLTEDMVPFADHWKKMGFQFDALYSGFLGSDCQIEIVGNIFDKFKTDDNIIFVDPVMGDHGKIYKTYTQFMCQGMKRLCRKADLICPNITEAAILLDRQYRTPPYDKEYIDDILLSLSALGPKMVVLTGVSFKEGEIGIASYDNGNIQYFFAHSFEGAYHGTGDMFASALISAYLSGKSLHDAASFAATFTANAIEYTLIEGADPENGMLFEKALPMLMELNK